MSKTFNDSLNNAILESCQKHLNSDVIASLIDERVQKTVREAVEDSLKSYSETGKVIAEAVKESLAINKNDFRLPELSHVVRTIVEKRVHSILNDSGRSRLVAEIDEIFGACPLQIKLSELVEQFKEMRSDFASCSCSDESCTVIVDERECVSSQFFHIHIDAEPNKRMYGCDFQIDVKSIKNEDGENQTPLGEVYSVKCPGGKFDKENTHSPFIGPLYGFDRLLFNLYANRSVLVIDEESVNTFYSDY